jgi:hypothetical protein
MPRLIVIDSGSTAWAIHRLFVIDSGGTARLIRRGFVIDSGGTAKQFFSGEPTIFLDPSYTVTDATASPNPSTATFRLTSGGVIQQVTGFGTSSLGNWIDDTSQAGNYEVRATLVSGTLSSGTTGSYLALTSNRSWSVSRSSPGVKSCTFTIEIRKIGTADVLDSATVNLEAAVDA